MKTWHVPMMRMNTQNMPQVRRRKEAVQRLGVSIGVRYSSTFGFQWWLSPYFFLLPGVRVLWTLYQSMMTLLLSSLALMQRCVAPWMLVNPRPCVKHEELSCSEKSGPGILPVQYYGLPCILPVGSCDTDRRFRLFHK